VIEMTRVMTTVISGVTGVLNTVIATAMIDNSPRFRRLLTVKRPACPET
jgi:hypothetical protein